MGISATIGLGAGLFTGSTALGIGAGLLGGSLLNSPKTPEVKAPPALPQAAKAPNVQGILANMRGTGQAGGSPGVGQTFLTGSNGVTSQFGVGKTTLLGG